MIHKNIIAVFGLLILLFQPLIYGMGLRSFVALPVEKGGTVYRAIVKHNTDSNSNKLTLNVAYGINHKQTFLIALPYQFPSDEGDKLADVSLLYRHIVSQLDTRAGTQRIGLLAGLVAATKSDRDSALQAGAVFTWFRGHNEVDVDVLYQHGLGDRDNAARYDVSWQHRIAPKTYPQWGLPNEWYIVSEVGGRWLQHRNIVHQLTLGLQWVANRWVIEGGVIEDLNSEHQTHLLLSFRFH
ncbi:MAG: hypothetical protein HRU20_09200 [Pseudomonadales bacterium]|nr:hypothetical protein [Pseudomonadales bacterium]